MRPSFFAISFCSSLAVSSALVLGGCGAHRQEPTPVGWASPLGLDHPLVGRVYDVSAARFVTRAELDAAAANADILLLGEQHDNIDHNRLQQSLLDALVARGRRPTVAFEQLDLEDQSAVDRALAQESDAMGGPAKPDGDPVLRDRAQAAAAATALAAAVDWDKSGWPSFEQYRPVFETAIAADLPIRATNLSRSSLMKILGHAHGSHTGSARTGASRTAVGSGSTPAIDVPLPNRLRDRMAADIRDSHCGYADEGMTAMMIEAQRLRDSTMARAVIAASTERLPVASVTAGKSADRAVVLICGFGHARRDYGVPLYLRAMASSRRSLSIALLEAVAGAESPADYVEAFHADELPFNYLIFTPRVDDEDPCEKFRGQLEKMKKD
jgi:uncharacterized iron-regulated protein